MSNPHTIALHEEAALQRAKRILKEAGLSVEHFVAYSFYEDAVALAAAVNEDREHDGDPDRTTARSALELNLRDGEWGEDLIEDTLDALKAWDIIG